MSRFDALARSLERNRITRRQALWLLGAGTAALSGCAASPVTGKTILVGMSEAQEKLADAQVAPHQFSQDLGAIQDETVNRYVAELGKRMGGLTHRPLMPYSYRVLNANYVNAYTFPGGAMGITRGILAELDDEAQLAALLGHELGHRGSTLNPDFRPFSESAFSTGAGFKAMIAKALWWHVCNSNPQT
mgnify:CR=1 FL=1